MIIEEKKAENFNCHYPDATHCAGSRCMAWRWATGSDDYLGDDDLHPKKHSTTHGYCGLAGRP